MTKIIGIVDFSLSGTFTDELKNYLKSEKIKFVNVPLDTKDNMLATLLENGVTHLILRAPCDLNEKKRICDEFAYLIDNYSAIDIFPSLNELLPYENKRYLSTILTFLNIPHPKTEVFFDKKSAVSFGESANFPLIHKTNIGASSSGVSFVRSKQQLNKLINKAFGKEHPYLAKGVEPTLKKFKLNIPLKGKAEKHFLYLQEVVDFKWEWRIIKSQDKILAYRKLKSLETGFASGSGNYGFGIPPDELLELNNTVFSKLKINTAAVDYFETSDGKFLVNEVQCLFGAKPILGDQSHQMYDEDLLPIYLQWSDDLCRYEVISDTLNICEYECWKFRLSGFLGKVNM